MDAYIIETLRSNGVTKEEMVQAVKTKNVDQFKEINEHFDYTGLYELEDLGDLLENGYQVKFLTLPGLTNLLKMRFQKEKDQDYVQEGNSLKGLSLSNQEKEAIEKWLSPNWALRQVGDQYTIEPAFN